MEIGMFLPGNTSIFLISGGILRGRKKFGWSLGGRGGFPLTGDSTIPARCIGIVPFRRKIETRNAKRETRWQVGRISIVEFRVTDSTPECRHLTLPSLSQDRKSVV